MRAPAPNVSRETPRSMDAPESGYWLIRVVKSGPVVPARIWTGREPEHEGLPIDLWPNSETRILGIFAEIAGKPVDVDRVWHSKGVAITKEEFAFRMADHRWAATHAPHLPEAQPEKPIRVADVPVPFGC